jgi:hypothetical protein
MHTAEEAEREGKIVQIVVLVVLVLLFFAAYNVFVVKPREEDPGATRRYVDRWIREQLETAPVRKCLQDIEGNGRVVVTFELALTEEDDYIAEYVRTSASALPEEATAAVAQCFELSIPTAKRMNGDRFWNDTLIFARHYQFPSSGRFVVAGDGMDTSER